MHKLLTIEELANLSSTTVQQLSAVAEAELLFCVTEDQSGSRCYTTDALPRLHLILALLDLDVPLEQVGDKLNGDCPVDQLRNLLTAKQRELQRRIRREHRRLDRTAVYLRLAEQPNAGNNLRVVVKAIEPQTVLSLRRVIGSKREQKRLWRELYLRATAQGVRLAGAPLLLWYDTEYHPGHKDVEVAVPVAQPVPPTVEGFLRVVPGVETAVSVSYSGSYSQIGRAYSAIPQWLEANRYHILKAPSREAYLSARCFDMVSLLEYLPPCAASQIVDIEVQFPVEKDQPQDATSLAAA